MRPWADGRRRHAAAGMTATLALLAACGPVQAPLPSAEASVPALRAAVAPPPPLPPSAPSAPSSSPPSFPPASAPASGPASHPTQ